MWEIDDAVEVHSVFADGIETPDQFLWRGRLWRVTALRSQWTETAVWWERGIIGPGSIHDPRATRSGATYDAAASDDPRPGRELPSDVLPARIDAAMVAEACSAARSTGPTRIHPASTTAVHSRTPAGVAAAVGVLDADWGPERTVFRVEAGCGRHGRRELFDLAHDPVSGRWQLERVTDR